MRSFPDRIRHAISFEVIGILLITPLGALAFHTPIADIGVVAVVSATIATAWNFFYNIGFDTVLKRLTGTTQKQWRARIWHAVLFEAGLLIALVPFIAWYLQASLWQALMMDVSFAVFYVVYAYVFNLAYDLLFPLPEWATEAKKKAG
ncbi:Uncharacterized membrane protein [Rhizobium sp. RU20A]|uniref:PACE efflux transporter n=1 Tax=Rhizobium sp. RU20A TaxID=1907412 RepID=UPI00095578E6|nr:PACE efflux transporter [Rhizobium sp. RU20A]SIQ13849.1 Uncharacterized membrane protein [Rhizobium sp. RU20A]